MDVSALRENLDFELPDDEGSDLSPSLLTRGNSAFQFDLTRRENLTVLSFGREDSSVHAGVTLSKENLEQASSLQALEGLIKLFAISGFSLHGSAFNRISLEARDAGLSFIRNLGFDLKLPRIVPDGEGALLLFWKSDGGVSDLAVALDGSHIHMVINPAGDDAQHVENLFYGLGEIPGEVLEKIPRM